jgi:hypothetical protein
MLVQFVHIVTVLNACSLFYGGLQVEHCGTRGAGVHVLQAQVQIANLGIGAIHNYPQYLLGDSACTLGWFA